MDDVVQIEQPDYLQGPGSELGPRDWSEPAPTAVRNSHKHIDKSELVKGLKNDTKLPACQGVTAVSRKRPSYYPNTLTD